MMENKKIKKGIAPIIKKIIKINILLIAAVITVSCPKTGKAAFEDIGHSARADGMGEAYVSMADDVSSIFYNPAGLSNIDMASFLTGYGGQHIGLDDGGLSNSLVGIGYPLDNTVNFLDKESVGFGWSRLKAGDLYREDVFTLGYGASIIKNLSAGLNMKMFSVGYRKDEYTEINPVFSSGYSKTALSGDLGVLYDIDDYTLGLGVFNIGNPDVALKHTNVIPMSVKLGVNTVHKVGKLSFQVEYSEDDVDVSIGTEKELFDSNFYVRGGLKLGTRNMRKPSVGFSYGDSWYKVDYSMQYPLSGVSNTFGSHNLNISFYLEDKKREQKPEPAEFVVKDFEVIPEEVYVAEESIVSADVYNKGEKAGSYKTEFYINGDTVTTAATKISANSTETVSASYYTQTPGEYTVRAKDTAGKKNLKVYEYPKVSTLDAENIYHSSAALNGELIKAGQGGSVYFRYRVEKDTDGWNSTDKQRMTSTDTFSSLIEELASGTTYQFKAVVEWDKGEDTGKPKTFTTKEIKEKPEEEKTPSPEELEEFEEAREYYEKLVESGAGEATRRRVLERIISNYEDTGIDLDDLREDLEELKE
ncbi:MAG: CARDB domain-containing protein [Elusimicrobiota bacterium]